MCVTTRLAVLQCKREVFLTFYKTLQEKKPSPPETRFYISSVGWKDFVTVTRSLYSCDLLRQSKTDEKCLLPSSQQDSPSNQGDFAWLTGWALLPSALLGKNVYETWRQPGQKLVTRLHFSAFLAAWIIPSLLLHLPVGPTSRPLTLGPSGQTFRACISKPVTFWWSDTLIIKISSGNKTSLGSRSPAWTINSWSFLQYMH